MIKRHIFNELKDHLLQPEISLLVGPRQAGKTTLMVLLKEYLEQQGEKTVFLSLDFESDQPFFSSQRALLNKIELEFGKKKGYVFIDEIQRKEDAGLFLKGLYDLRLPCKFIISGSGSLELKEKIHESLAGRKRIFEITTISFEEFVNFKTDGRYEQNLESFFAIEKEKTKDLRQEYLSFGGYPRVVLAPSLDEKKKIIDEIYRSYLERDISYLLKVEKLDAFRALIKMLAAQVGRVVNFTELSSSLGISVATAQNYFAYAQKTFILQKVTPFFKNARSEIIKSPVVYFHDLGLRNYVLGLWGNLSFTADQGFIFQNFVFRLLKEKFRLSSEEIHFWRTKDQAEVDFVIETGTQIIPVEVKFKELKSADIERSMRNFIQKYRPAEAWVVHLGLKKEKIFENTKIKILPFYELMKEQFYVY